MEQAAIAEAANVSRRVVGAIEDDRPVHENHRRALVEAYEALGLEFFAREDGGAGVVFLPRAAEGPAPPGRDPTTEG